MSQIIGLHCTKCEAILKLEVESCLIVYRDATGTLGAIAHEFDLVEDLADFIHKHSVGPEVINKLRALILQNKGETNSET